MNRRQSICYCQINNQDNYYYFLFVMAIANISIALVAICVVICIYRQFARQLSSFRSKYDNICHGTANPATAGKNKTICNRPLPQTPNTNSADMNKITQCSSSANCQHYVEIKQNYNGKSNI